PSVHAQLISLGTVGLSGGVTLQSGNLDIRGGSLGTGTFVVNGGNLRLSSTISNAISLNSDLVITGATGSPGATLAGVISSATAGTGLSLRTTVNSTLTLNRASTFDGATR